MKKYLPSIYHMQSSELTYVEDFCGHHMQSSGLTYVEDFCGFVSPLSLFWGQNCSSHISIGHGKVVR